MSNRSHKNWNNFSLGLFVMILPLLALPEVLTTWLLVAAGFFIALFSLARVGRGPEEDSHASSSL